MRSGVFIQNVLKYKKVDEICVTNPRLGKKRGKNV
jgi:hypothetical protein